MIRSSVHWRDTEETCSGRDLQRDRDNDAVHSVDHLKLHLAQNGWRVPVPKPSSDPVPLLDNMVQGKSFFLSPCAVLQNGKPCTQRIALPKVLLGARLFSGNEGLPCRWKQRGVPLLWFGRFRGSLARQLAEAWVVRDWSTSMSLWSTGTP